MSPSNARQHPWFGRIGIIVAMTLAWPRSSSAQDACNIEVRAPQGSDWERASRELAWARADGDCARIAVEAEGTHARLVFTTRDGRTAVRELRHPTELGPAISALRVTLPADAPPPRADPSEIPQPRAPTELAAAPSLERAPRSAAPAVTSNTGASSTSVIFGLSTGARGGADRLATPVLGGSASMRMGGWELGVHGRLEIQYRQLGDTGAGVHRAQGIAAGIGVGRREPVSNALALAFGGTLLLAVIHDELDADGKDRRGREFAHPRLGGYVGLVLPRRAHTRFRLDLAGEVVATSLGESIRGASGRPIVPWCALGLTVGVELGGP